MALGTDYDPDPDLAALRPTRGVKLAVTGLFAVAVTELGTYLQLVTVEAVPWVTAWIHAKAILLVVAVVVAMRLGRMRPDSRLLHPLVALVASVESIAWIAFSFSAMVFSLFAFLVAPAALFALALTPSVLRGIADAEAARERLAANGIDDPFA